MQHLSSIFDITSDYDALILDLWGVVHDGTALYPGVRETLAKLHEQKKQIVFLSNAPRRAFKAAQVLASLGVAETMYDHVITSGEAVYHYLSAQTEFGKNYYYLGPDKDLDILDGLDYKRAGLANADFILNVGFFNDFQTLEEMDSILKTALILSRPMICVNPDRVVVKQNGERLLCAGLLAEAYEKKGGRVLWYGKPHAEVYRLCMRRFDGIDKRKVLAVGDGIETDILGASKQGIASVFVTGGIAKSKLLVNDQFNESAWQEMVAEAGVKPDYIVSSFR